ncbi:MAG: HEPN domain-containing protein [Isosphaeraceae bacterium]
MKRLTAKWVRKAEDDLGGAKRLERDDPPYHDLVCFHRQQSAEKYLKAVLQEWEPVPPRTHDLVRLLDLLLPRDPDLGRLRRRLNSLTLYALDIRYPIKRASRRNAQAALRHVERIRQEIRTRLGLTSE